MNLNLVLIVDVSQDVITGNGVTAVLEFVLANILLADVYGLLAIEFLRHDKQTLLSFRVLFLLLPTSQEWYQLSPATLAAGVILAIQLVQVFLAQQNGFVGYS